MQEAEKTIKTDNKEREKKKEEEEKEREKEKEKEKEAKLKKAGEEGVRTAFNKINVFNRMQRVAFNANAANRWPRVPAGSKLEVSQCQSAEVGPPGPDAACWDHSSTSAI